MRVDAFDVRLVRLRLSTARLLLVLRVIRGVKAHVGSVHGSFPASCAWPAPLPARCYLAPAFFLSSRAVAVTAKANAAALKLTTAAAASGYASFSTALVSNSTGVMAPLTANGVMGLAWVDTVLGLQAQKLLVSVDAGAAALP
jgi:hypothetical protein